jgi:hypothetical protein
MKTCEKTACYAVFLALSVMGPATAVAADVDFSCIEEEVRPIIQVSDQHQEFDVVMRNECPGAVYWATCIERMDPWTHRVKEIHTPTGHMEAGKQARVNLQMKNIPRGSLADGLIEEFYVSYAYAIRSVPTAACVARECEAAKQSLREQVTANDRAWSNARQRLAQRLESECPASGWGTADVDACRDRVRAESAGELQRFVDTDAELQGKLKSVNPIRCTVHGGGANRIR